MDIGGAERAMVHYLRQAGAYADCRIVDIALLAKDGDVPCPVIIPAGPQRLNFFTYGATYAIGLVVVAGIESGFYRPAFARCKPPGISDIISFSSRISLGGSLPSRPGPSPLR